MTVCKECRNCDWFWEEHNLDKECLGEEQPCERFMCLKGGRNNISELKIENRRWIVEGTITQSSTHLNKLSNCISNTNPRP